MIFLFNPIRGPLEFERDTSLSCPGCCDDPVFIEQERETVVIGRPCLPPYVQQRATKRRGSEALLGFLTRPHLPPGHLAPSPLPERRAALAVYRCQKIINRLFFWGGGANCKEYKFFKSVFHQVHSKAMWWEVEATEGMPKALPCW